MTAKERWKYEHHLKRTAARLGRVLMCTYHTDCQYYTWEITKAFQLFVARSMCKTASWRLAKKTLEIGLISKRIEQDAVLAMFGIDRKEFSL